LALLAFLVSATLLGVGVHSPALFLICAGSSLLVFGCAEHRLGPLYKARLFALRWREIWIAKMKEADGPAPTVDAKGNRKPPKHLLRIWRSIWAVIRNRLLEKPDLTIVFTVNGRRYWKAHHWLSFSSPGEETGDLKRLHNALYDWHDLSPWHRWVERRFIVSLVRHLTLKGHINVLAGAESAIVRLFASAIVTGLMAEKCCPLACLGLSDLRNGIAVFLLPHATFPTKVLENEQEYFEALLGGKVSILPGPIPGSIMVRRWVDLPEKVYLPRNRPVPTKIGLGANMETGEEVALDILTCFHGIFIGSTRGGKSNALVNFLQQILSLSRSIIDKVWIIDMKGGVSFVPIVAHHYRPVGNRTPVLEVVWDFNRAQETIGDLYALIDERLAIMRRKRWVRWQGARSILIVDEVSLLQNHVFVGLDARALQSAEENRREMLRQFTRLATQGAGVGLLLFLSTQHQTVEHLNSTVLGMMESVFMFRVTSKRQSGLTMGESDEMPIDPTLLTHGQCNYRNPQAEGGATIVPLQSYWSDWSENLDSEEDEEEDLAA
jgi:hypothetical protein